MFLAKKTINHVISIYEKVWRHTGPLVLVPEACWVAFQAPQGPFRPL